MFRQNLINRLNKLLSQMASSAWTSPQEGFLQLVLLTFKALPDSPLSSFLRVHLRTLTFWLQGLVILSSFLGYECPLPIRPAHCLGFSSTCLLNAQATAWPWEVKSRVWLGKWWVKRETRMVAFKGALTILPCVVLTMLKEWMLGSDKLPFPHFHQWWYPCLS